MQKDWGFIIADTQNEHTLDQIRSQITPLPPEIIVYGIIKVEKSRVWLRKEKGSGIIGVAIEGGIT